MIVGVYPDQNKRHVPVLVHEVLKYLLTDISGVYVDATAGMGGHCEAILEQLSKNGRLIGIDRDQEALGFCRKRLVLYRDRVTFIYGEMQNIDQVLHGIDVRCVDGIIADLGVSSCQLDTAERGFSYLKNGPLDMRMDMTTSVTAAQIVNTYSEQALADIFFYFGEERHARRIARKIVDFRKKKPITTTGELSDLIRQMTPVRWQIKTLSRVFQGLRIAVNNELDQLKIGLQKASGLIKSKGRMVVISFIALQKKNHITGYTRFSTRGKTTSPTLNATTQPKKDGLRMPVTSAIMSGIAGIPTI